MRAPIVATVVFLAIVGGAAPPLASQPGALDAGTAAAPRNRVDELVFAKLKTLNLAPASLSADAVFLRRVYLDVIGTVPTVDEARSFLEDRDANKRAVLVDRLLQRDEFADYWAMKWADVLRVKSEFPINLWPNAVQAYHHWIRASLRDNVPYDRFARGLLTASGSNFRVPPANFYRAVQSKDPQTIAAAVALTFMGARVSTWPKDRQADLAAFFSQIGYKPTTEWKEEIVFFDQSKAPAAQRTLTFPDGTPARVLPGRDPREAFAAWLVSPKNPWFARAAVNRVWYWLVGRGIVHEPDDIRPDNPARIPDLLAFLEEELVAANWDMKHVYRLILNSATYQLSSTPGVRSAEAEAHFAYALLRPLEAEVLVDALNQIAGTSEQYASPIPEPFTFIPPDVRSVSVGDASITSAFLETFGRSPRDTGLATERNTRPTAAQRLYLLNGADVQRKIQQGPKLQPLLQFRGDARQAVTNLYLAILSRYPTDEELQINGEYANPGGAGAPGAPPRANAARRQAAVDLAWALFNTAEFRYRR